MDKNNKFKMAADAILTFIYRSQLVHYCTYLHKIWQLHYIWGPTYMHAKKLNENKIQDGVGRHLNFLRKQQ